MEGRGILFGSPERVMLINRMPHLEEWIAARVADGEFASVEDGVRQLVEEKIAERDLDSDDFAWAKPLIDEGLAALERGEAVTAEELSVRTADLLAGKTRR